MDGLRCCFRKAWGLVAFLSLCGCQTKVNPASSKTKHALLQGSVSDGLKGKPKQPRSQAASTSKKFSVRTTPPKPSKKEMQRRRNMQQYESILRNVARQRVRFKRRWLSSRGRKRRRVLAQASAYLGQQLIQKLFPAWYGVPWIIVDEQQPGETAVDFTKRKRAIAAAQRLENPYRQGIQTHCSLFVTTTLKHLGFRVERYKLSWQLSSNIIRTLTFRRRSKWIVGKPMSVFLRHVRRYGRGVFLVGLDDHTGYIVFGKVRSPAGSTWKDGVYFCHADYGQEPQQVRCEPALRSPVLTQSRVKVLGKLFSLDRNSLNTRLVKAWLFQRKIRTVGSHKE